MSPKTSMETTQKTEEMEVRNFLQSPHILGSIYKPKLVLEEEYAGSVSHRGFLPFPSVASPFPTYLEGLLVNKDLRSSLRALKLAEEEKMLKEKDMA